MLLVNNNDRVSTELYSVNSYDKKPLVTNKRAHSGSMYAVTFGYDDVYKLLIRIEGKEEMSKVLEMAGQTITVSEWEDERDYFCKKATIKKASYLHHWYYIDLEIIYKFVRA